jgi:tetratricopeptide (TPR) repeat protein
MRALAASLVLALAACSSPPPPAPHVPDPTSQDMATQHRLARFALQTRKYDQALFLYEQALARAYARDDAAAIGEIGYELAVVQLRLGEPKRAELQVRDTKTELTRRGVAPFVELRLVEALALYEQGRSDEASIYADALIAFVPADSGVAARAWHLRGMVAANRGDVAGINRSLGALDKATEPALVADRAELDARREALVGPPDVALAAFDKAATLRRDLGDHTGMVRALAFAAELAASAGRRADAADRYLRAARSANADGRRSEAVAWLGEARRLAAESGHPELIREAGMRLDDPQ